MCLHQRLSKMFGMSGFNGLSALCELNEKMFAVEYFAEWLVVSLFYYTFAADRGIRQTEADALAVRPARFPTDGSPFPSAILKVKQTDMKQDNQKVITLKTLTKNNVWDIQENDVIRLWEGIEKEVDAKVNLQHYLDIIRTAFLMEKVPADKKAIKEKYEKMGYKVGHLKVVENGEKMMWAIKKRPISRVTDLTYENIHHISAAKLLEVVGRNFGGGWDSLSQSIQDIIENGFEISTTTLPKDRLRKAGGLYEKKVADGFEVLEIEKGTWVEAIFAKVKPVMEKPKLTFPSKNADAMDDEEGDFSMMNGDEEDDELEMPTDFNDDEMTEDNYRTTFEIETDEEEESENLSDDL